MYIYIICSLSPIAVRKKPRLREDVSVVGRDLYLLLPGMFRRRICRVAA